MAGGQDASSTRAASRASSSASGTVASLGQGFKAAVTSLGGRASTASEPTRSAKVARSKPVKRYISGCDMAAPKEAA